MDFLDFEAPARVSKKPKLGVGFLEFRKLERELEFWILRLPLEFPKTRSLGWVFLDLWNFGNSRSFGVLVFHPLPGQTGNTIPGSVVGGGDHIYIYLCYPPPPQRPTLFRPFLQKKNNEGPEVAS